MCYSDVFVNFIERTALVSVTCTPHNLVYYMSRDVGSAVVCVFKSRFWFAVRIHNLQIYMQLKSQTSNSNSSTVHWINTHAQHYLSLVQELFECT